jgi:hypothetical protein
MAYCSKCGATLGEDQSFCATCGQPVARVGAAAPPPPPYAPVAGGYAPVAGGAYPVDLWIERPAKSSRGYAFFSIILPFKPILLFVQFIVLYIFSIGTAVLFALGQFAILFTGKFPRGWHAFIVKMMYWQIQISAFELGLRDDFPPFSPNTDPSAVTLVVPYPERSSRGWALATIFYVKYLTLIPQVFVAYIRMIAAACVWYVSQWAVLFTGEFPPRMHSYLSRVLRWNARINAFTYGLRDEYPPFSVN